jgi:hypothetical protein
MYTQRENPCLPCVKIFAVRFISGARQRACLPCVFYIAHDKEKTHAKQVVCRAPEENAQQRSFCRAFFIAHDKVFFSPYAFRITQMKFFLKYFAVRILSDARQTHVFAVRFCYSAQQSIFYLFSLGPKSNYS